MLPFGERGLSEEFLQSPDVPAFATPLIQLTNLVYNLLRFEQIKRLGIRYTLPAPTHRNQLPNPSATALGTLPRDLNFSLFEKNRGDTDRVSGSPLESRING